MRPERLRLFAQLAEGLMEVSSTSEKLWNHPGAIQIMKHLHSEMKLAHDTQWEDLPRIYWSEFKDTRTGKWVLIKGSKGTGAIKSVGNGTYLAVGSNGAQVQSQEETKGGRIEAFLKPIIGNPGAMYSAEQGNAVRDKQQTRARNSVPPASQQVSAETIVKKFKPMWKKAIVQASADIQGFVMNQVKNGAFEKAQKKLRQLQELRKLMDELDEGDEAPELVKKAVGSAIALASAHFYPEETGELTRGYGGYGGTYGLKAEKPEGTKKLLADLSSGDTNKMGVILGFFKRSLLQ
jgi:hypothetical protein